MPTTYRTWISLSRSALHHNLKSLRQAVGPKVGVLPILKANAYGHGLSQVWPLLTGSIRGIGVAHGHEGLTLRQQGYGGPVVVLSGWEKTDLPQLIRRGIELVAWDAEAWTTIQRVAKKISRRTKVHLKLDTGTTRIGFLKKDIDQLDDLAQRFTHTRVVGIFSHLANAEERTATRTTRQIKYFTTLTKRLSKIGGERHIACTAAVLRYPASHMSFIRPGIGLYGLWPSQPVQQWSGRHLGDFKLKPVLGWKTRLLQVKRVPAGTSIGYGSTVRVRKPTTVGILPIGYSDGYRRTASRSRVAIAGRPAPVLGVISMNLMAIDLSQVRQPQAGMEVELIGPHVPAEVLAQAANTIHYDIIAGLNPSIPRIVTA